MLHNLQTKCCVTTVVKDFLGLRGTLFKGLLVSEIEY